MAWHLFAPRDWVALGVACAPLWWGLAIALSPGGDWFQATGFWERAYFVTNALLPLAAIAAVLVARDQLQASRRAQKAEVYLELERRWDSLLPWRKAFTAALQSNETFSIQLDRLHASPEHLDSYIALMKGPYFFESVGLMARKQYLDERDIIDLLGIALETAWDATADHIGARRAEIGDQSLFREFEEIARKAKAVSTKARR